MPKATGQSMTAMAYEQIRMRILEGGAAPGSKVKISDLVKELELSLGAVREALSRLGQEGLVIAETNKGYRVAPLTEAELTDLTNTRVLIECQCLENAIRNGTLGWESEIVAASFELSRLTLHDPDRPQHANPAWNAAHKRYHAALVAACDSPWLLRLREMLFVQSERYRSATLPFNAVSRDLMAEHEAIAQAALARDTAAATAALAAHLRKTRQILIDAHATEAKA